MAIINFVKSVSDADQDRLDKIQACINLNKAMVYHDYDYQDQVMEHVDKSLTERNDIIQDFAKRAILNCFTKISMTKTAQLARKTKYENINPFSSDNKVLLNMNNYKTRYAENADILKRDQEKLFLLSQYIPMEITSFENLIEERMNKRVTDAQDDEKRKKDEEAEEKKKEQEQKERENQKDQTARIGEANLSIFKRLGTKRKRESKRSNS